MAGLPGVNVGPLDPDSTSQFGNVAQNNSARQLIRLHRQLHPPAKIRALARPLDAPRTKGLDLDEVSQYIGGLTHPNGDPLVPEDCKIVGAAVRGDPRTGQIVTFTYEMPSGRVGKWFAPYTAEALPDSFDQGAEYTRVHEMKERGLVAFDSEGTRAEVLERHNAELRRQVRALQAFTQGGGEGEPPAGAEVDGRNQAVIADENERLGRENEELRARLAQYDAIAGAQGGGANLAGVEEVVPPQDTVASADEPVAGYDNLKADEAIALLKAEDTDEETRQRVLEYEKSHANRRTVVSAGEQALGASES